MITIIPALLFYYQQLQNKNYQPEVIKDYLRTEALISGVNPDLLIGIATAESNLNPDATSSGGDRGLFQISKKYNSQVSDKSAYDPIASTEWAINTIKADKSCRQWSTCRKVMDDIKNAQRGVYASTGDFTGLSSDG